MKNPSRIKFMKNREERSFMNEVEPWYVDEMRHRLRRLKSWGDPELEEIDRELFAHGIYTRTLEEHLEQAQRQVKVLIEIIEELEKK